MNKKQRFIQEMYEELLLDNTPDGFNQFPDVGASIRQLKTAVSWMFPEFELPDEWVSQFRIWKRDWVPYSQLSPQMQNRIKNAVASCEDFEEKRLYRYESSEWRHTYFGGRNTEEYAGNPLDWDDPDIIISFASSYGAEGFFIDVDRNPCVETFVPWDVEDERYIPYSTQ